MIERIAFGRTGHDSSRAIFGAAALGAMGQDRADRVLSLVLESGAHPAALKDQVTTPAGSTIAGLLTMEDGRIRSVLARTIQEATRVAAGLGGDG